MTSSRPLHTTSAHARHIRSADSGSDPGPGAAPDAGPATPAAGAVTALLGWFDARVRDVPWRGTRDPYAILVAEVMAQQTRLETVAPYYRRFLERFPDAEALAGSTEDEVLKEWEGLGYYARARNLRRAAGQIVERHAGEVPSEPELLRALAGVGPYTAGAVASLAFGRPEPAVDGNARRVLCRLFDIEEPRARSLDRAARRLIQGADGRPGAVNQALMDLGSELCTPRRPRCADCPVADGCVARRRDTVHLRPPAASRTPKPERHEVAAVIARGADVLVVRRPPEGLLGGLWDFPGVAVEPGVPSEPGMPPGPTRAPAHVRALERTLREDMGVTVRVGAEIRVIRHVFSHFKLRLVVYRAAWEAGTLPSGRDHRWADAVALRALAFPVYHRRLISEVLLA